jgi:hypothetical protein
MDWQGNVDMQVEIGTAFWLFLIVVILALILWYSGYLSKVKDTIMNSSPAFSVVQNPLHTL